MAKDEKSYGLKEVADLMLIPYSLQGMKSSNGDTAVWTPSHQLVLVPDRNDTVTRNIFGFYKSSSGTAAANRSYMFSLASDTDLSVIASSREGYYFDSLKVSNIEVSSEDTYAKGGKGNPDLVGWSYAKEVTLTIENALLDMPTLNLMMGAAETLSFLAIGDCVIRNYATGKDHLFRFVIPKCKPQIGATLAMEAEGDPSTFEMTIKAMTSTVQVLRWQTSNGSIDTPTVDDVKKDSLILFFAKSVPKT